ncbi:MAG: glycerophosphodiester phosphodiesterase [Pirellulaceae bacterium]
MNADRAGCVFQRVATGLLLGIFLGACLASRVAAEADEHTAANDVAESPSGYIISIPAESTEDRLARHKVIAQRRSGSIVIVHRGAWALAPENTLEAYAAAMDFGADGCEIDIRRTADGVLVMFHDDGLDRMTDALGRINQYTHAELLTLEFRSVYGAQPETRIPTLAAVLELARQRAMLLHLDVKESGLEDDIAELLDAANAWDHIVEINEANATALRINANARLLAYKAFGWQEGRMDVNPQRVAEGLAKPGNMIMVDDPRVAARELNRMTRRVPLPENLRAPRPASVPPPAPSRADGNLLSPPAYLRFLANRVDSRSLDELGKLVTADFPERTDLEGDSAHQQQRARRILQRAWAAQKIGQLGNKSTRAVELLEDLVAHRSLHRDFAYQGLDGAMAGRALGTLGATESVPFLVRTFLAVDPGLKEMVRPPANYPYAWADYRMKGEIVRVLGELPCEESKKFLRDYLAMDDATAGKSAAPLFEEATQAYLHQQVTAEELEELLRSTNSAVRGTTILACLDDRTGSRVASLEKMMPWTQELPRAGQ